ncbi:hypothetical protein [Vibrio quintilis]|uniref:Uncharacterized protein n=1 Tax=Vibrio quintilis TaxID=1117707 RepID=A0A1M7YP13_9VIBR|nr:hypothetical protein [Vibrio quintilis]SHO54383.1 hypothetical protein VQ7734_00097 [Vibrio quintilis]
MKFLMRLLARTPEEVEIDREFLEEAVRTAAERRRVRRDQIRASLSAQFEPDRVYESEGLEQKISNGIHISFELPGVH